MLCSPLQHSLRADSEQPISDFSDLTIFEHRAVNDQYSPIENDGGRVICVRKEHASQRLPLEKISAAGTERKHDAISGIGRKAGKLG